MTDAKNLAQKFHETYERLALEHGYDTREESKGYWEDVPERNRKLMVATVQALIDNDVIAALMPGDIRPSAVHGVIREVDRDSRRRGWNEGHRAGVQDGAEAERWRIVRHIHDLRAGWADEDAWTQCAEFILEEIRPS